MTPPDYRRAAALIDGAKCPDCDSIVTLTEVTPNVFTGQVEHDDGCPWLAAFRARGGGPELRR